MKAIVLLLMVAVGSVCPQSGGVRQASARQSPAQPKHATQSPAQPKHATQSPAQPKHATQSPAQPKHPATHSPDAAFCVDACAAGLGAPRCGDAAVCRPPTFTNATAAYVADMESEMEGSDRRGKPRDELCPQLCPLALGDPLCHCKALRFGPSPGGHVAAHQWRPKACDALCKATGRSPSGCPSCTTAAAVPTLGVRDIDWDWWCHVLCLEGDGGLACLCDINP